MGSLDQSHPDNFSFVGQLCTFTCGVDADGRPLVDPTTGLLLPGETKLSGEVVGQTYLGFLTTGKLRGLEVQMPNWNLLVRGQSGAEVLIDYRVNTYGRCW